MQAIGGKWPTIDIYAELDDPQHPGMFCFFQVKSTTLGRNAKGLLKVKVSKKSIARLCAYHGPTYLIGVDYNEQLPQLSNAFILHVKGPTLVGVGSMPTTNQLNHPTGAVLLVLRNEIMQFWQSTNLPTAKLNFTSTL